jgi:hypothetical protein
MQIDSDFNSFSDYLDLRAKNCLLINKDSSLIQFLSMLERFSNEPSPKGILTRSHEISILTTIRQIFNSEKLCSRYQLLLPLTFSLARLTLFCLPDKIERFTYKFASASLQMLLSFHLSSEILLSQRHPHLKPTLRTNSLLP